MRGTYNLAKKYFLSTQFKIVQNFTIFVRSAPVEFPSKIQFFKKLPKIAGETLLLMRGTNNLAKKYSLSTNLREYKISLFL